MAAARGSSPRRAGMGPRAARVCVVVAVLLLVVGAVVPLVWHGQWGGVVVCGVGVLVVLTAYYHYGAPH